MNRFSKKCTTLFAAAALACTLTANAWAMGSLDHFKTVSTYTDTTFSDVSGWYAGYVETCYELGLFSGTGTGRFSPDASMTAAEAVKLAACLHSIYETGSADFVQGDPWWQVYADYCLENSIMEDVFHDYSNAISRAQFAVLLAAALPDEVLSEMNAIADEAIPDVHVSDSYGPAVYKLYRAGVFTGTDSTGAFHPNTNIRRSEVAAVITRMVRVSERKSVTLGTSSGSVLTAEQVYAKCAPSVFSMITYDANGEIYSRGSGVFLSADGTAVTNWHVLDGVASAEIITNDGKTYKVLGVYDYDVENDLARIQIGGSGFTPISVDYSGSLLTGATVYAIGNPQGLENSLSAGLVSSAHRTINSVNYIQITTPISSGSSGGALINARGQLVGITTASMSNGQNLNLAIPITALTALKQESYQSVSATVSAFVKELSNSFKLSKSSVRLSPGGSTTVTCSIPGIPSGYSVSYEVSTRSIVQCSWGEWGNDDSVALTLTGQNLGDVTVTISLHNRSDEVLAQRTIEVAVR